MSDATSSTSSLGREMQDAKDTVESSRGQAEKSDESRMEWTEPSLLSPPNYPPDAFYSDEEETQAYSPTDTFLFEDDIEIIEPEVDIHSLKVI